MADICYSFCWCFLKNQDSKVCIFATKLNKKATTFQCTKAFASLVNLTNVNRRSINRATRAKQPPSFGTHISENYLVKLFALFFWSGRQAVFNPRILIFWGGSKSFGTHISENHLGTSFVFSFGWAWHSLSSPMSGIWRAPKCVPTKNRP